MHHHANGECGSCHDDLGHEGGDPMSIIGDDVHVTMGMVAEEHAEDCDPEEYCECETVEYSKLPCEGCGSVYYGERHAFTLWAIRDHRLNTLGQIKDAHKGFWFDKETLRWFKSRVSETVYPTFSTTAGTLFVSSEMFEDGRRYTVRCATLVLDDIGVSDCDISTIGEYGQYKTRNGAHAAAKRIRDKHKV